MVIKGTDLQVSQSGFRCVCLSIKLDEKGVGIRTANLSAIVLLVNVQNYCTKYLFQTCRIFLLQKAKIGKTAQELAPCSLLLLLIQNYDTFSIIWYMKHADEGQITNIR